MIIKSFVEPQSLNSKAGFGTPTIRLDCTSLSFSPSFALTYALTPKQTTFDICVVEHDQKECYALIVNGQNTEGVMLKGNEKSPTINNSKFVEMLAKHYHLETIIEPKGDFKSHKFDFHITLHEGKTVIILLPPKKYGE